MHEKSIREIHKKAALWLVQSFNIILLPKFNSSQVSRRLQRKINSNTVRKILGWAHYRFVMRLASKVITFVPEAYTKHAVVVGILRITWVEVKHLSVIGADFEFKWRSRNFSPDFV